jgi:protein gp37
MPTKITWADETINPIIGCSKESEGCQSCYAENMARRLAAMGTEGYQHVVSFGRWNGLAAFVPSALKKPYSWKRPRSIFVGSMGDIFMKGVPFEWIDETMRMIWENKQHTFIFLTKHPARMQEYFSGLTTPGTHTVTAKRLLDRMHYTQCDHGWHMEYLRGRSLPNLVLGVSAEHQAAFNDRVPVLMHIPAVKRFVSMEPMIGPIELTAIDLQNPIGVIVGGESGNKARRLAPEWVMTVRDQCAAVNAPFMFKQWSHENRNEVDTVTGLPYLQDNRTYAKLLWDTNNK